MKQPKNPIYMENKTKNPEFYFIEIINKECAQKDYIQWNPLNGIMVNIIIRLLWSKFIGPMKCNYSWVLCKNNQLMLSDPLSPKMITLSGFHCISKINSQSNENTFD